MCYSYCNGYREGVVFAFIKDKGKVLIEHRKVNNKTEVFFTSGSIELKDHNKHNDYRINALFREVKEEFRDNIEIDEYVYLNELIVEPIKIIFYLYLITDWKGTMPKYTFEDGKDDALLEWVDLKDKEQVFEYKSALEICKRIEKCLKKGEL